MGAAVKNEPLLALSGIGLLASSLAAHRLPHYSATDAEVLLLLWTLSIATYGLARHGMLPWLAQFLERGKHITLKLTVSTFLLSMFVTNDVCLLSVVPLTLYLNTPTVVWTVVLETLAANAGSALFPTGNPQNLFIYCHYKIPLDRFVVEIAPLVASYLMLLVLVSILVERAGIPSSPKVQEPVPIGPHSKSYMVLLFLLLLVVLKVLPVWASLLVPAYSLITDRKTLKVDYGLLLSFACFFGFTDNLRVLLSARLHHTHHVFASAMVLSQVISNVPATLLLADFTRRWQALLWGASVGGFGVLWGSLASLISYRLIRQMRPSESSTFLKRFHLLSVGALMWGAAIYVALYLF